MKKLFTALLLGGASLSGTMSHAYDGDKAKREKSFDSGVYVTDDGKLRLNVINHRNKSMLVRIRTKFGETLHQNYIRKSELKTAINYNISELESGEYQVYVTDGANTDIRLFSISDGEIRPVRKVMLRP